MDGATQEVKTPRTHLMPVGDLALGPLPGVATSRPRAFFDDWHPVGVDMIVKFVTFIEAAGANVLRGEGIGDGAGLFRIVHKEDQTDTGIARRIGAGAEGDAFALGNFRHPQFEHLLPGAHIAEQFG